MNGPQGTHSTKMCADKSAENTPNAPKIFGPKVWDFRKNFLWVSLVRGAQGLIIAPGP